MSTATSNDVAIIGVGIHPFGRFEGKSAMEMCVDAIDAAVTDAGVAWDDIGAAAGGSWTVANPDAIVGMVGLSGIPFTNVFNACATAASGRGWRCAARHSSRRSACFRNGHTTSSTSHGV